MMGRNPAGRLTLLYCLHMAALCVYYDYISMFLLSLGYSAAQAGLFISLCSLVSMVAQPLWGAVCDRAGGQRAGLCIQYITGAAAVAASWIFSGCFPLLLVCGAVFAASELSAPPLLNTLCVCNLDTGGFSRLRGIASTSFALTAAVCGRMFAQTGYFLVFILHSLLILGILLLLSAPMEMSDTRQPEKCIQPDQSERLIYNRPFLALMASTFLLFTGYCAVSSLLSVVMDDRGGDASHLGIAFLVCGLSEAAFMLLSRRLLVRFAPGRLLACAMFCFCIKILCLLGASSPGQVILAQLFQGIGYGVYYVVSIPYIGRIVPQKRQTLAQSVNAAVSFGAGSVVGSFLGGQLADRFGVDHMLAAALASCLLAAAAFALFLLTYRGTAPAE